MDKSCRSWIARSAAAICLLGAGAALAAQVTFESDPLGFAGNGFVSVDSNLVTFSASPGGDLQIMPEVGSSEFLGTRGLAVFGTPEVSLSIQFAFLANALELAFGNDDFFSTVAGDQAVLVGFLANVPVVSASVALNRNDLIDQSIAITGLFDRATFFYTADRFLAETLDNVTFSLLDGVPPPAMPEPASAWLLVLGLAALLWRKLARGDRNGGAQA